MEHFTFNLSDGGRERSADVSVIGRNTQGVRLIRLGDGEQLTGVERSEALEVEGESGPEA